MTKAEWRAIASRMLAPMPGTPHFATPTIAQLKAKLAREGWRPAACDQDYQELRRDKFINNAR